ncbi:MAG: NAD(P)-dependent oxidoreductase, partial [Clostridium sp.]|nr:NAD(P)-dependent oxidoreductase [Roseburia sp.]MCM1432132.1 NAD(P)-dependent oxidoreductase [Muribaculaceae bacterium]MCM1499514.1 NAD(P)-dependent oxidoreductase [Clostridium sp.]
MKILVTGANGYLGQGIVSQLLDRGHEVIATDFSVSYVDVRAKRISCDLFAIDSPDAYFGFPEVILHLAWRDGFVHNSVAHIKDLPKHYIFLKRVIEEGVKQLVVMGSMHEVGFFEGSINEDTPTNPSSLYGISKNALRQSITLLCKDNDTILQWLRGYYIVGNSEFGASIFSKIVQAEKDGKDTFPFTSGQNQWDFLDYEEFCNQVV